MRSRISKWGNSLGVRIPKALGAELDFQDGSEVEISVQNGALIITPVSSNYHLEDLVQGITPENRHSETDWGNPSGSEVW